MKHYKLVAPGNRVYRLYIWADRTCQLTFSWVSIEIDRKNAAKILREFRDFGFTITHPKGLGWR